MRVVEQMRLEKRVSRPKVLLAEDHVAVAKVPRPLCLVQCVALQTKCSDWRNLLEDQITVRVPTALRRALRRTSRRLGRRPSDVVRMALEAFLHEMPSADRKPAERVAHLLGSLSSGVPDLAQRHREYVMSALKRAR